MTEQDWELLFTYPWTANERAILERIKNSKGKKGCPLHRHEFLRISTELHKNSRPFGIREVGEEHGSKIYALFKI